MQLAFNQPVSSGELFITTPASFNIILFTKSLSALSSSSSFTAQKQKLQATGTLIHKVQLAPNHSNRREKNYKFNLSKLFVVLGTS